MKRLIAILSLSQLGPTGMAQAQDVVRLRGIITAHDGKLIAATRGADGRIVASRIQVNKDVVRPPQ
jgi:hypothetical protein